MNSGNVVHIRRWVATAVIVAALIAGGALAIGLRNWSGHEVLGASRFPVNIARDSSPVSLGTLQNGFASILKPALPAVVNITSSKVVKPSGRMPMMPFNDPFFQQFFGGPGQMQPRAQREESLGSGVIVTSDGTILTNNHVIEGASDIKVQLSDKRTFTAKLVGADKNTDIAVLKIPATNLPAISIGDSSKLQVGDVILAIGEPFGLQGTATMGIVSATGRTGLGIETYEDFIQTDAAINPGNSGGAMINLHGDLIGINTAIATGGGSRGNEGIGFAIPINMARHIMDEIEAHGKVTRGFIGVLPNDVDETTAKQFGLSQPKGAIISEVDPNTPGARAGLKQGDIILSVNGTPINGANQLRALTSQMSPGSVAKLEIWRDRKTQEVDVKLGDFPETAGNNTNENGNNPGGQTVGKALQGVQVQALTGQLSSELNVPTGIRGVVVSGVDDSSPAADSLQRGMIIEQINRQPVSNIQDYRRLAAQVGDQPVLLLVYAPTPNSTQPGASLYITIQPE